MGQTRRHLMGRKTYEVLAGLPAEHRDAGWEWTSKNPTTVFSRTLNDTSWPATTLCADDAVKHVRGLKGTEGSDLRTVGSLSLVRQLLNAGLVDRLRLIVFPVLLGQTGRQPVFHAVGDFALQLHDQRVLDGRIVLLDYRPGGSPPYAS